MQNPKDASSTPSTTPAADANGEAVDVVAERKRLVDDLAYLVVRQYRRRMASAGSEAEANEDDSGA